MPPTPRILAVEPDRSHALALKRFVQSCVDVELLLVDSVAAAKASLAEYMPQAVLVSELVSPDDDVDLTAHVRNADVRASSTDPRGAGHGWRRQ